jgi:hypothetical protein
MPNFHVAWRTRSGAGATYADRVLRASLSARSRSELLVLARDLKTSPSPGPFLSEAALRQHLQPLATKASLTLELDHNALVIRPDAISTESRHYFRLADGTVRPLPAQPAPLHCAAGDAYVALSPGVQPVADGHAIAHFIHVRDDFNADKLAQALLDHVMEVAGADAFGEDVTVLVVETR